MPEIVTPLMVENVESSATPITDAHKAYRFLKNDFKHIVVKHTKGVYKTGRFHTNNIENFWSILKRGIYGVYHQFNQSAFTGIAMSFQDVSIQGRSPTMQGLN